MTIARIRRFVLVIVIALGADGVSLGSSASAAPGTAPVRATSDADDPLGRYKNGGHWRRHRSRSSGTSDAARGGDTDFGGGGGVPSNDIDYGVRVGPPTRGPVVNQNQSA
ncbi:hypothetical protein [Streptomyces sp. NRRL F-2580]|uniref:hypothetical protein n=1 Tax=Streptomyces sp. NRRL F-2580 TaxID=1463841 RepID=UPI0004C87A2B|nr:hypothetical protein [Streptomyces sp. NRRL F-2580]